MQDEPLQSAFVTRRLKPSTAAAAAAGEVVRNAGSRWATDEQVTRDASALAQALVLHSVRHARSELRISVGQVGADLLIELEDSHLTAPNGHHDGPALGGPGLELVAELADQSGCDLTPTGRRLWVLVAVRDALPAVPAG
jgi:hypothetical protein